MKSRILLLPFILMLALVCFLIPTNSEKASAETITQTSLPTIEYYDENGNRIYPYSQKTIESFQNPNYMTPAASWSIYRFGKTTFTYNVWIRGGSSFYNPGTVMLEASSTVRGKITIRAYDGSKLAGSVTLGTGWTGGVHVPFTHLPRGKSYKFQLVNGTHNTTIYLSGGEVWYNG